MTCREARAILAIAPPPATATKLTRPQIRTALKRSGRRNHVQAWTEKIHAGLRAEHLRQPALVEDAFGHQALALPAVVDATCASAAALEEAATAAFRAHPDYEIITSFPGLGDLTGARLLGEVGDDRVRFTDARALKAYARGPHHPGRRTQPHRRAPAGEEPAPGRGRPCVGVCRPDRLTRSKKALRPARRPRRSPRRRPAQPLRPVPRLPVLVPDHPPDLPRTRSVPHLNPATLSRLNLTG